MKVSIVVPVYNVKNYLKECMESLINQTLQDIEIIAVDDGSTDGSADILTEYAQKYPQKVVVFHKENGGQASARNLALDMVKGEYVGFVDSDDWVEPTMYDVMYHEAEMNHADIVICDMIDHYPTYEIYHHSSDFESKFKVTPSACNKLFRKESIGNDKFPHGLWYEDFEFTTKQLMKTEKIASVHQGFYHCHCREVSTMNNNNSEKNLDILQVLDHLQQFTIDNGWEEKYHSAMEYLVIDHVLITSINRVARQTNAGKKSVITEMRNYVKQRYPHFTKGQVYREMSKNRRIIAWLNACGLHNVSKMILDIKEKTKKH